MRILKLTLAYDGTRFVGWQRQADGESIQGLLEEALARFEGAPVTVHAGAYTAAGSAISEDVPAGSLGISRAPQHNVEGWVERKRPGTKSAKAAAAAAGRDAHRSDDTEDKADTDRED